MNTGPVQDGQLGISAASVPDTTLECSQPCKYSSGKPYVQYINHQHNQKVRDDKHNTWQNCLAHAMPRICRELLVLIPRPALLPGETAIPCKA